MGDINPLELSRRIQVVRLAQQIVDSGAHYLWGAQGNGQVSAHGTVRMRPNTIGAPEQTYLYAAYTTAVHDGAQFVCAGRPEATPVQHRCRATTVAEANGLASQSGQWLWPRYYRDADSVNPNVHATGPVLGECCTGKLHFDCGGFVRHCFREALHIPISRMRDHAPVVWEAGSNGAGAINHFDLYPADLLYSGHHVGIATGRTEYGAPSPNSALHAWYAMKGVVRTPVASTPRWTTVRRWRNWGV